MKGGGLPEPPPSSMAWSWNDGSIERAWLGTISPGIDDVGRSLWSQVLGRELPRSVPIKVLTQSCLTVLGKPSRLALEKIWGAEYRNKCGIVHGYVYPPKQRARCPSPGL